MRTRLEIELDVRPLERVSADIVVAGFFVEDRPLRGAVARIDWRLCGLVSQLIESNELAAEPGSALLASVPGALKTPRALLLGLGSRVDFVLTTAQDVTRDAVERCVDLGVRRIALSPLGVAADDFPRYVAGIVGGAAEALRPSRAGGEGPPLELSLVVRSQQFDVCNRALEDAVEAVSELGVTMRPPFDSPRHAAFDRGVDRPSALHPA